MQCGGEGKKKKSSGSGKENEKRPGGEVSQNTDITHSLMESPYKQIKTLKFNGFSLLQNEVNFTNLKQQQQQHYANPQTTNIIDSISF